MSRLILRRSTCVSLALGQSLLTRGTTRVNPSRRSRTVASVALLAILLGVLLTSAMPEERPTFLYGQVVDINPGSHVISVLGDNHVKWRLKVTSETELEKYLARPQPAVFEDLSLGVRVRVLVGSRTMNPTIRLALRIFIYR